MVDSLKQALDKAPTDLEKVETLDMLSRTLMNVDLKEAEVFGQKLIMFAEETRDRKLMIKAYMSNGTRCSYFSGSQDYTNQSIGYFNKALELARQNRMDKEIGEALLKLSYAYLTIPEKEKALNLCNQASSILTTLGNDSLLSVTQNLYGDIYLTRNEKILALRHYFNGLRIAEKLKIHSLIRNCYRNLSGFYLSIGDYDKAIDYGMLAYKQLDLMKEKNVPFMRATDVNSIGNLYAAKKSHDIAISYFERSITMADSLKFATIKIPGYISLLNQYLRMEQPRRALNYFTSERGIDLRNQLIKFGFSGAVDQAFAVIYTDLNQLDSADFYFKKALPYFEANKNEHARIGFFSQLGYYHKKAGNDEKAIGYFKLVKEISDKVGMLESSESAVKYLDTLYAKSGNYQLASLYNSSYYQIKDSIEKLNKEKELAQIEASDEQYRQKQIEEELATKKRRKNNIQYMGITIGIVGLFVMLVVLGMFRVSANTIRLIGFFAFLMFFEFIFLIFKKNIFSITHGEPWKDLAFMIALAALLLPLHHYLEHRVIKYLTSHNRLTDSGKTIMSKVFVRRKTKEESPKT
jgi:tetratricopeptide (TPR) repeat protein